MFFVWWIRGSIWPGAFIAFFSCIIIIVAIISGGKCAVNPGEFDLITCGAMPYVWSLLIISMAPWLICKFREITTPSYRVSNFTKQLNIAKKLNNYNKSKYKGYTRTLAENEIYEFHRDVLRIYKENLKECGLDVNSVLNYDISSKINVCFLLGICKEFLEGREDLPTDKEVRAWAYVWSFPKLPWDKTFEKYSLFLLEVKDDIENKKNPNLQIAMLNGMNAWKKRENIDDVKNLLNLTYKLISLGLEKK